MKKWFNFILVVLGTILILQSATFGQVAGKNVKINGMIQIWTLNSADSDIDDGFLLKRSEFKLSGYIISDIVGFNFMLDPASVPTHLIQDLNIFYQFSPQLKVAVGQMHYPLTMEGLQPSSALDFIDRSILASRAYGDRRDIGLLASGAQARLDYAVGVFNGSGTNTTDNNNSKDIAGRVALNVTENIHIGGSGYYGANNRMAADTKDVKRNRVGFEFAYVNDRFGVKSEFMTGTEADVKNRGFYGTVTYTLNPKILFGFRFDNWDPDLDISNNKETITTFGASYKLHGNAAKIMINYLLRGEEGTSLSNNELLTQFQVEF